MEPINLDFSRTCRTCRKESTAMCSIYSKDSLNGEETPTLGQMLMACTTVQVVSDDGLPNSMCNLCVQQLQAAYQFKLETERSDKFFKSHLEVFEVKLIKEENRDNEEIFNFIQVLENDDVCKNPDGLDNVTFLHKCKLCDKRFSTFHHMQRHQLIHNNQKVYVCKICNKTLTRLEHLKRHLIIHLKDKPHNCKDCNKSFTRFEHLERHMLKCKGTPVFSCEICNKSFNREDSLEVHRKVHQNQNFVLPTLENLDNIDQHYVQLDLGNEVFESGSSDDDLNTCEPLDELLSTKLLNGDQGEDKTEELNDLPEIYAEENPPEIILKIENMEDASAEDNDEEVNTEDSDDPEFLLAPMKRKRGRPRKRTIKYSRPRGRPPLAKVKNDDNKREEGANFTCSECDRHFFNVNDLENHVEFEHVGKKIYECRTCDKKFVRIGHLKRHLLIHSGDRQYPCDACDKKFSREDHLQLHKRRVHDTTEHVCDICFAVFNREQRLLRHKATHVANPADGTVAKEKKTRRRRKDDKSYQCDVCSKLFISKSHLTEHMKFHTDSSKKFLCSECGQRFIRNDYLIIHMRRHRGEKPFKCKYCGKGFPRTTDLKVHERYHTGEKTHLCVVCGRGFGRAYNLTVHMRTHTGEKPYQCTYCDARFAQGNDLKAHVRRHTGERFHCELCPETFLMGYLLTQHKRSVHGLNIVSNIRRLKPKDKLNPDDPPPITVPLPQPVIPGGNVLSKHDSFDLHGDDK